MCAHHRAIEQYANLIVAEGQRMEHVRPHLAFGPTVETVVDGLPRPEARRQIAPRRSRLGDPKDSVHEVAVTTGRVATDAPGQEFGNLRPLLIGQFVSMHSQGRSEDDPGIKSHLGTAPRGSWSDPILGMSHIHWSEGVEFNIIGLEPEERVCAHCSRFTYVDDHKHRFLHSLGGPLHVVSKVACCPDKECPGHSERLVSPAEMSIAPPYWSVSWDLFAWMGQRRFARHWSVPQICAELRDRFKIEVSADLVEDYTAKYEVMVAARESDLVRLVAEYKDVPDLILSIDGLQPEKGHETLYVVRELRAGRVWFAEPLLSSATAEIQRLFERARDLAARIGKPVRCWISDKQNAFVSSVLTVFPGVPHRYCANHFLRDAAKPVLEADSHAKVQMRRKVRGLRDIERRMLLARDKQETSTATPRDPQTEQATTPATDAPVISEAGQVVLDYCAAVRGILNDDQGGPLHPPGVRMAEALHEVRDSSGRAQMEKKGVATTKPSTGCKRVLSAARRR